MNKTILRYFLTVLVVTLALSSSISMVILSDIMLENTKHDMLYSVKLVEYQLDPQNNLKQQETLKACYFDAPDLQGVGKNGYRFINAVSDMAYHGKPLRQTKNYNENLFRKTIDGLPVLDKTYQMVLSA
mgnify:CR=1 FL=1